MSMLILDDLTAGFDDRSRHLQLYIRIPVSLPTQQPLQIGR